VQRAEGVWMRIIGILLVLLGLTLLASPLVTYGTREKVIDTESVDVTAKRQKTVVVPRVVSVLVIGAGVLVFVLGSRRPQE
jgi:uncharacterized membrane protein YdcZ (DUF606 family)